MSGNSSPGTLYRSGISNSSPGLLDRSNIVQAEESAGGAMQVEEAFFALIALLVIGLILLLILAALGVSGPQQIFSFFAGLFSLIFVIIWARISGTFSN